MKRSELLFSAFCAASGLMAALGLFGVVRISGALSVGLYPLYSIAAASGWVSGNFYVVRTRSSAPSRRWMLVAVYLIGPAGPLSLLRAMAEPESILAAPAVPLFAFGVHAILFLVPITLRSAAPERRSMRLRVSPSAPQGDRGPQPGATTGLGSTASHKRPDERSRAAVDIAGDSDG